MTQFEGIPPLPSSRTYQQEIFHLVTRRNLDSTGMIAQEAERRRQSDHTFRGYLGKIGTMSYQITEYNRPDHSLGDEGAGDAFTTGAVFGTLLAEEVHKGAFSIDELLLALPQPMLIDHANSRKELKRDMATPYLIEGILGYQLFVDGRAQIVLEPLERRIVSDDTKRYFFNVGLGLILLSADTVHRSKLGNDWSDLIVSEED